MTDITERLHNFAIIRIDGSNSQVLALDAKAEIERLRGWKMVAKTEIERLRKELEELYSERHAFVLEIERLREEVKEMKATVKQYSSDAQYDAALNQELRDEIERLRAQVEKPTRMLRGSGQ
jgi:regulator of replication initiation timing